MLILLSVLTPKMNNSFVFGFESCLACAGSSEFWRLDNPASLARWHLHVANNVARRRSVPRNVRLPSNDVH